MTGRHGLTIALALLATLALGAPAHSAIKKCKDEKGQWHYGDSAAAACAKSTIIEMTDTGTRAGETAAPLTETELAERERTKHERAKKKKEAEEQARKDDLLLATYGHEKDILYVRDRKLAQIERSIKATEVTLKTIQATLDRQKKQGADKKRIQHTESQVAKQQAVIAGMHTEQEQLRARYTKELERYRKIKARQALEDKKTKK